MKYLYGFLIGHCTNSILTRLEGARPMDAISYPIAVLAMTVVAAILYHKRTSK